MWDSGYYLAEFAIANASLFSKKKLVELGAGIGLTAIVLHKFCEPLPDAMYMTDYVDVVLNNCVKNMDISEYYLRKYNLYNRWNQCKLW